MNYESPQNFTCAWTANLPVHVQKNGDFEDSGKYIIGISYREISKSLCETDLIWGLHEN